MNMMQIKMLQSKPIEREAHILADLKAHGWDGSAEILRRLAGMGAEWRQRNENECSYAWAGNSPGYVARTEKLGHQIILAAKAYGLEIFLQSDCRGAPVYVDMKPISDTDYNRAHCLYWRIDE